MAKALIARLILVIGVCSVIFYNSRDHIAYVASHYGHAHGFSAQWGYAITIDCTILISALTLVANRGVNKAARNWARAGRWFGFVSTVLANLTASGFADSPVVDLPLIVSILICAIPGIALIIVVELVIHSAKATPATRSRQNGQTARKLRAVA